MPELIPLWTPDLPQASLLAVTSAITTRHIGPGPLVRELEASLASRYECRHCVCTVSGSAALHVLFRALTPVIESPAVCVPRYGYFAAAEAAVDQGWRLGTVEVNESANVDPDEVAGIDPAIYDALVFIRHNGSTSGLEEVLDRLPHGMLLLEDMACSLGPKREPLLGHAGVLSFAATKWVTCGQGGAILTDSSELARLVRDYCDHGGCGWRQTRRSVQVGNNLRLDDIRAAMVRSQLPQVDERWTRYYTNYTASLRGQGLPVSVGWMPQVMCWSCGHADRFVAEMRCRDIVCEKLYPVLTDNLWARYCGGPIAEDINSPTRKFAECTVFMPSGPGLAAEQIKQVCKAAKEAYYATRG